MKKVFYIIVMAVCFTYLSQGQDFPRLIPYLQVYKIQGKAIPQPATPPCPYSTAWFDTSGRWKAIYCDGTVRFLDSSGSGSISFVDSARISDSTYKLIGFDPTLYLLKSDSTIYVTYKHLMDSVSVRLRTSDSSIAYVTSFNGQRGAVRLDTASLSYRINQKEPTIAPSNTVKQYWNGFKQFVTLSFDSITTGTIDTAYTNAVSNVKANSPLSVSTVGKIRILSADTTNILATQYWVTNRGFGTGSVTSVALSMPGEYSVSSSPITTSGTLSVSWGNQTQGKVFASPASSTGTPSFRALVASDVPSVNKDSSWKFVDPSAVELTDSTVSLQIGTNTAFFKDGNMTIKKQIYMYNGTTSTPPISWYSTTSSTAWFSMGMVSSSLFAFDAGGSGKTWEFKQPVQIATTSGTAEFTVAGNAAFGTYTSAPTSGIAVSGPLGIGTNTTRVSTASLEFGTSINTNPIYTYRGGSSTTSGAAATTLYPEWKGRQGQVNTTNASQTTIYTLPTDTAMHIWDCWLQGKKTNGVVGPGLAERLIVAGHREGSTATIDGVDSTFLFRSITNYNFSASVSSSNILLQVIGASSDNVTWTCDCEEHKQNQ